MNPWQMLQTDFATFVDGSRDGNVSGPTSQQGSRCQLAGKNARLHWTYSNLASFVATSTDRLQLGLALLHLFQLIPTESNAFWIPTPLIAALARGFAPAAIMAPRNSKKCSRPSPVRSRAPIARKESLQETSTRLKWTCRPSRKPMTG